jgi:hypothetical protein
VVSLRCTGQAVVQAIAEDAHRGGLGVARTKQMVTCRNPTGRGSIAGGASPPAKMGLPVLCRSQLFA